MAKMPQLPIEGLYGIARAASPMDHETGAEPVLYIRSNTSGPPSAIERFI